MQGKRKRGQATFSLRKRKSLLMDRTTEKVACPLFLRVCRGQALSSGMPLKQGVRKYLLPMARPDPRPLRRANGEWR